MSRPQSEFYVGYHPRSKPNQAKFTRQVILGLLLAMILIAFALVLGQTRLQPARFEFGHPRHFEGVVFLDPYPRLVLNRPGISEQATLFSTYLLTAQGKHGADQDMANFSGQPVRLSGTLIYRDGQTMIEVVPGTVRALPNRSHSNGKIQAKALGEFTLVGEIVDSKCYLGVMRPGNLKTHKSCAVRCISGGVPPVLVVRDAHGNAAYFLLVARDGQTVNQDVLDMVAEPVRITGQVFQFGDFYFLHADPATYQML